MPRKPASLSGSLTAVFLFLGGSVALAGLTLVCFRFHVSATTVGLLFLIVLVVVSLRGRFVPAGLLALVSYLLLDYFFTEPLFTLGMNQALDFVAPVAYLSTAFIVTRLASEARKSQEEQRLAQEQLRKAQAELAHVTRVVTMGELAASIAHEINQPLAAIVNNGGACLRWLADEPANLDEARQAAQRIIRDGNRASDVIKRIRAFLRKTEIGKRPLDLNEIIREVAHLTRNEATEKGITVRLRLAEHVPLVSGDRVQLQQVLLNLVMNSIEAIDPGKNGSREIFIESSVERSDSVMISVRDSGIGIDEQVLKQVFEPFYTTKPQGLGMGLAVSRSIVEDHGGRLWATPASNGGAVFQFTLPVNVKEQS